jgi:hypothetical protein
LSLFGGGFPDPGCVVKSGSEKSYPETLVVLEDELFGPSAAAAVPVVRIMPPLLNCDPPACKFPVKVPYADELQLIEMFETLMPLATIVLTMDEAEPPGFIVICDFTQKEQIKKIIMVIFVVFIIQNLIYFEI